MRALVRLLHQRILGVVVQRLEVGVAIFFVLSGFLLSRPYLVSAHDRVGHEPARRYLTKRVLRIFPVYVVSAIAALALIEENRSLGIGRWIQNLLLVDLYRENQLPQGLTQMWSLTVEVAFYLILPLLGGLCIKVVCRDRWRPVRLLVFLAASAAGSLAWVLVTHNLRSDLAEQAAVGCRPMPAGSPSASVSPCSRSTQPRRAG